MNMIIILIIPLLPHLMLFLYFHVPVISTRPSEVCRLQHSEMPRRGQGAEGWDINWIQSGSTTIYTSVPPKFLWPSVKSIHSIFLFNFYIILCFGCKNTEVKTLFSLPTGSVSLPSKSHGSSLFPWLLACSDGTSELPNHSTKHFGL